MLQQFKTHMWGYFEYVCGCILHVNNTQLSKFDNLQEQFLRALGLSAEETFLNYNFAPVTLRRDIAMLGFVYKRILKLCHPKIQSMLPTREADRWDKHSKPIDVSLDDVVTRHTLFFRSIFGTALMYNRLSQSLVDEKAIVTFQRRLTSIAKSRCATNDPNWILSFHDIEFLQTEEIELDMHTVENPD